MKLQGRPRRSMSGRSLPVLIAMLLTIVATGVLLRREGVRPGPEVAIELPEADSVEVVGVPAEAASLMEAGRYWRAARLMEKHLAAVRTPSPDAILVAARAEAGWGGWSAVRSYLEGRPWLDDLWGGEGWFWLARSLEEAGDWASAIDAFERYIDLARDGGNETLVTQAELRLGLLRLAEGEHERGEDALAAVRERAPYVEGWIELLKAESLARAGDTASVRAALPRLPAAAGMRHRGRLALLRAYEAAGDRPGLIRAAVSLRAEAETASRRAEPAMMAGRAALEVDDTAVAGRELRLAVGTAPGSVAGREAAALMLRLSNLTPADRLAIADVYARHGNPRRAADGYRAWLEAGGGSAEMRENVRLRLGQVLFDAGEFAEAEAALRPLLEARPAVARPALLLTGRALYRRGQTAAGFDVFERLAREHPGSVEGSEGLYLVADLRHDDGDIDTAARTYRRVADTFPGTDRAGLSLMRLAGVRYLEGEYAAALEIWDEYRRRYPSGERWLQSAYWAGRAHEQLGDTAAAMSLYRTVRQRDPLSYYAVRASERLGIPFWPVPLVASPPDDPAAKARVDRMLLGVDLLRSVDLHAEAEAELQRVIDSAGNDPSTLYTLAEAVNERGYAIQGIRIGQRIQASAAGMNLRLLRILYPFPYRALVEAEAVEHGLDPFVVAALMRQESLFTPRISSPVGARGLMQIMPETGAALAEGVGIEGWNPELLFQPEINVHLGVRYLAEQMKRYEGSLPSVFSAYNAGPHRVDAWRNFPEYGDEELFTERIPYRETRDYVKILTRNIELYRGLYGDADRH